MKKSLIGCFVLAIILVGLVFPVYGDEDTAPRITAFTTDVTLVDRAALSNRTARIPVSWTTAYRPVYANLVFEQILPDGDTINVELPRVIPWVNSNGDGVAAPILPAGSINEIVLRVRLYNLFTNDVYDEQQLTVPVGNGGNHQTDSSSKPTLVSFTASSYQVLIDKLEDNTARVPVSWKAINRPVTANLVFEQVLPDGTAVNVELPRENPWVNSEGDGVVAPLKPGDADTIHLRLRFVDLLTGKAYDQRDLTLLIVEASDMAPEVSNFATTATSVNQSELEHRTAHIPVTWSVKNRPENSNLVFEQVLSNGTAVNVELPRDNAWVSSSGNGVVAPYEPGNGVITTIQLQVRLVDLDDQTTLAKREISLPIYGLQTSCFSDPFPADNGFEVGLHGTVNLNDYTPEDGLAVMGQPAPGGGLVGYLEPGQAVTIISGPACYGENGVVVRQWQVQADDHSLEGWIHEYSGPSDTRQLNLIIDDTQHIVEVESDQCYASPFIGGIDLAVGKTARVTATELNIYGQNIGADKRDVVKAGEQVTITEGPYCYKIEPWASNNQNHFRFWRVDVADRDLEGWVQEYAVGLGGQNYYLEVLDDSGDDGGGDGDVEIISFSANTESAKSGDEITVNWEVHNAQSVSLRIEQPILTTGNQAPAQTIADLPLSGSRVLPSIATYIFPDSTQTIYLEAYGQSTDAPAATAVITLNLTCNHDFFNGTQTDCIGLDPVMVEGVYQAFEHGFMIWYDNIDRYIIIAFLNDGTLTYHTDDWSGEDITFEETPPEGLQLPQRGFGKLWTTNPTLRDSFGWAIGTEQSYPVTFQIGFVSEGDWEGQEPPGVRYFSLPDGRTIRIQEPTWTLVSES